MRCPKIISHGVAAGLLGLTAPALFAGEHTVTTAVSARAGNGYKRVSRTDGSFKPEYYALSNGGRVPGTTTDTTIDRVAYPEVAAVAMRMLAGQNYHLGRNASEATLLISLQWGATQTYDRGNYGDRIQTAAGAFADMQAAYREIGGGRPAGILPPRGSGPGMSTAETIASQMEGIFENEMFQLIMKNRMRDQRNLPTARVLGFVDEINGASRIPEHTAAATRHHDLIADIEDPRYYIIVWAYDFRELRKHNKKKLLWMTRVSVTARGNEFDDSAAAMLKSAAKYFGQNSGKLVRSEEDKGTVALGEVKFFGEAAEPVKAD